MNILFLTIYRINNISEKGIYTDLMRKFRDEGHNVYIVSPSERRYNEPSRLHVHDGVNILNVKTLNLQKTNVIEKGFGTLLIEKQYLNAIKKHFASVNFDLILYSTPPITFIKFTMRIVGDGSYNCHFIIFCQIKGYIVSLKYFRIEILGNKEDFLFTHSKQLV